MPHHPPIQDDFDDPTFWDLKKADELVHQLLLDAGRDAEKADRFEEAIPIFRKAVQARPRSSGS